MQTKHFFTMVVVSAILLLAGCSGSKDTPVPVSIPGITTLSLPANNTACLKSSSTIGSSASVTFSWSAASNADSYQLEIKNLNTQTTASYTTSSVTYTASLVMNIPYSWDVIAVNASGKTTSDAWQFYLSGVASSSYAPFPADLTAPALGTIISSNSAATVEVTFLWKGSDPDNDIASYAFYLDNTNANTQVIASQTASTTSQTLESGKIYYWKVVTTDKAGNSSTSAISSFQIN
jgi:hypothetical protein